MLAALLTVDFPGVEALREQARTVRAAPGCECGCGTIDLHPAGGPPAGVRDRVPVEATVVGPAGEPVGLLLLFVDDGRLSALEVAPLGDLPLAMPPPDRVTDVAASDPGAVGR
ncbi:hypothetical protein [Geodermatophilus sp. DSM 45219]|uniref:hypothetical protein n=1 Tax=Geodermatophilus sp. DSM 45219 TaxID=1881103 RepID=UPI00115FEEB3|nr:hypothetical protein [Geodermatophilus sp. DSM 45219]